MADYIDREELLNKIGEPNERSQKIFMQRDIIKIINNMPSIDAQPVVRCKDCVYRDEHFCTKFELSEYAEIQTLIVNDTNYCKWGEKE